MPSRFPALKHPGFRNFWYAQLLSVVGTWMQNISLPWLAYTLTDSPFMLGLMGTFQYLPSLLLSMPAGVLVDRNDKRRLVLLSQSLSALGALAITVFLFAGGITYTILLGIALLLGLAQCLDFPSRQSWMLELVGKEDLGNAVALNSSAFNAARIVGPAVAGLLMATMGIRFCFLVNTLSFVPVLVVIALSKSRGSSKADAGVRDGDRGMGSAILEGLRYTGGHRTILKVMVATAIMGIFALNFSVLLPVKVKEMFGASETSYGFLMSAMGIGSLSAALILALRRKSEPLFRQMPLFSVLLAGALALQGLSTNYWLSAALMILSGFFAVCFFTTATSTMQYFSDSRFRGRVMALYSLCFGGMTPIGNLFCGTASQWGGSTAGFVLSAAAIVAGTVVLELASNYRTGKLEATREEA